MNDILKTLKMIDSMNSKKSLNESAVAECGDMGGMSASMPAAENQGNPVTASITLNASGMNHVADLMRLLQQAGLEKAGPAAAPVMPMRMDIEKFRDVVDGPRQYMTGTDVDDPEIPGRDDVDGDVDTKDGMLGGLAGGALGAMAGGPVGAIAGGYLGSKVQDAGNKESSIESSDDEAFVDDTDESYVNEPDEEYQDHNYMLDDLAGGINKPKKMYKPAAKGDNPMAVEAEADPERIRQVQQLKNISDIDVLKQEIIDMVNSTKINPKTKPSLIRNIQNSKSRANLLGLAWNTFILGKEGLHSLSSNWKSRHGISDDIQVENIKDRLYNALKEKKSKPDFLDIDKDGDRKEPMKKAVADKKKKPFAKTNEAAKPDFLDIDKDGDRKEPMKKAVADKKKKAPVKESDYQSTFETDLEEALVPDNYMIARIIGKRVSKTNKMIGRMMGSTIKDPNRATIIKTAIFGSFNNPLDLTDKTAEYSASASTPEQFIRAAKKVINDPLFNVNGVVLFFSESESTMSTWRPYVDAIEELNDPKIQVKTRETVERPDSNKSGRIKPKNNNDIEWGSTDPRVIKREPREKKTVNVFRAENPKLVSYMMKKQPEYMNKYYKASTKEFTMNQKTFDDFKKIINSPAWIKKFGETLILMNRAKTFSENNKGFAQ